MTTLEAVVNELKNLPAEKLGRAAAYIHRLKDPRRGERLRIIRKTNGCLTGAAGSRFAEVIRQETVDFFKEAAKHYSPKEFEKALAAIPDIPPEDRDQLE